MEDRNPSRQEWLAIKSKFTHLYYIQRKQLQEVRHQLQEENNGFWASESAFKRKITDWGLQRRYTAAEKDALCQHSTKSDPDCDYCSDLIRRKPITPSKIQRHKAARRKEYAHRLVLVPVPVLGDSAQSTLRATQDLWLCQVGSGVRRGWNREWCDMDTSMVANLTDVAIFLERPGGVPMAELRMHQFRQALNAGIVGQPIGILLAVIEMIVNKRWLPHPKTQANLFRSIRNKIVASSEVNPCLYQIFHAMETPDALRTLATRLMSMQVQTLLADFNDYTYQLFGLLKDGILNLVHCQQTSEALQLALAIPQNMELCHQERCEASALISRCQLEFGAYHEAVVSGNQVLRDCEPLIAMRNESYAYTYINTCDVLARCHDALADIPTVVAYRTCAYTTALEIFGTLASNIVYHHAELKRFTKRLEQ